jgi:CubicO group peptidase (beta-lactamase class C family)
LEFLPQKRPNEELSPTRRWLSPNARNWLSFSARYQKKPFAEIVDEIVAKPLKLSSLRVGGTSKTDVVPYRLVQGKRQPIDETTEDWRLGAGAIKSNLPDALRFVSALIKSSILTPESSKELFKRRAIMDRKGDKGEVIGVTYGFLRVGEGPDATIAVDGLQPGVTSVLMIFPRQQMASVIFANATPLDLAKIQLKAMEVLLEK